MTSNNNFMMIHDTAQTVFVRVAPLILVLHYVGITLRMSSKLTTNQSKIDIFMTVLLVFPNNREIIRGTQFSKEKYFLHGNTIMTTVIVIKGHSLNACM